MVGIAYSGVFRGKTFDNDNDDVVEGLADCATAYLIGGKLPFEFFIRGKVVDFRSRAGIALGLAIDQRISRVQCQLRKVFFVVYFSEGGGKATALPAASASDDRECDHDQQDQNLARNGHPWRS